MVCNSCQSDAPPASDPRWRRMLWIALAINLAMFLGEIVAGIASGSRSLQADALDFLGDSANYAISLGVAGLALGWRSRAALLKGGTILAFGLYVLVTTVLAALGRGVPQAETMGIVGVIALIANGSVALMLYRYRGGDANMRSVWICSRNDAIGNLAVLLAAAGVVGTGTAWPDLAVALIMAGLGIWGGLQIISQAHAELRLTPASRVEAQHSLASPARHDARPILSQNER
ncbi:MULTISPECIES: cation transporter [unclassified Sphingobium]|uniref:cation transporter n=1 Tax=unclassified Sphingobium TaxID=2611147 RepID=UPI000D17D0F4|nr:MULTISPECIES: cation transporter [unclassified Sphingobium]PSO10468.1 cation transporter [Sphingobium sp. AEW4]TWD03648.1 cation efflux family protein [Sphingobium sp. AEW010]TWD21149.1 cation efflux family protein [Sphingobium sp. AEW013]TWD23791.1 cation efflux family protein [Sphingobium sp. AEW001]